MGYPPTALENLSRVLFGFNGLITISLGDVVLPIQAGPIILNVRLFVVEDLSLYNTILGWLWLYKMKVIPSIYHQLVSYLTEVRQVDLHGS